VRKRERERERERELERQRQRQREVVNGDQLVFREHERFDIKAVLRLY
jgi:hypothetical protein